MGYSRVGFTITGVDIKTQKHYPFEFVQGDALEYLAEHGHEFDVIHASPPCQGYSIMRNLPWLRHKEYQLLIHPTRVLLEASGREWVIENVMGAKLPAGWLCGNMFGLPFFRHRYFEASRLLLMPAHVQHRQTIRAGRMLGNRAAAIVYSEAEDARGVGSWPGRRGKGEAGSGLTITHNGAQRVGVNVGHAAGVGQARAAMGLEYMTRDELAQAIPPAYTEYIGRQLMVQLVVDKASTSG